MQQTGLDQDVSMLLRWVLAKPSGELHGWSDCSETRRWNEWTGAITCGITSSIYLINILFYTVDIGLSSYVFLRNCWKWWRLHYQVGCQDSVKRGLCASAGWHKESVTEALAIIFIWWQVFIDLLHTYIGVNSWWWVHFLHRFVYYRVTLNEELFGWIFMNALITMDTCFIYIYPLLANNDFLIAIPYNTFTFRSSNF